MKDNFFIVPSRENDYTEMKTTTIELARKTQGKLYRKHILNKGTLIHPVTGGKISVDDEFVSKMITNFNNKVCDIVQVPLANDKNEHSEDPERNIGEVVSIEEKDGKVYAIIDARKESAANELGKTLLGASAMLSTNYTDTKTGEKVGPTLLHACVTNRPYITDLEDYEEIVAASADNSEEAVLLTEEEPAEEIKEKAPVEDNPEHGGLNEETEKMTKEEMLSALKAEHGIDVEALQEQAATAGDATALSNAIVGALKDSGLVALSNTEGQDVTAVTKAVTELASEKVALSNRVAGLEKDAAEAAVDALIEEGRIVPSQKKAMVEVKLSNVELFNQLVPAEPLIKMSNEQGSATADEKPELDVDKEVARLVESMGK